MPEFTSLELAVLSSIVEGQPAIGDRIRALISSARLSARDNTGHGFFTKFDVDRTVPPIELPEGMVSGPDAEVQVGERALLMGFILWLDGGYPNCLEGFQYAMPMAADVDLKGIDLGDVRWFRAMPLPWRRPQSAGMDNRDIWFERWLWSYMPCNWKGWVFVLVLALGLNVLLWILVWVTSAVGHPEWDFVPFLPLIPGVILGWWVAERHSLPRK